MGTGKQLIKYTILVLFIFFLATQETGATPANNAMIYPAPAGGTTVAPVVQGYETLIYRGPNGL